MTICLRAARRRDPRRDDGRRHRSTHCPSRAGSTWPPRSTRRPPTGRPAWSCCGRRAGASTPGVDIKEMQQTEGFDALLGANRGCFAAFKAVYECAVPVVAAVHGFCLGGGVGLIGNADVIVASEDAYVGVPEVDRGALGAATHLARLVPPHLMRTLYFTGRTITAAELHAHGSVFAVVPRDELDDMALAVAADIAAKDPRVMRMAKEALNAIDPVDVNRSYRMEQGFTMELNLAGVSDELRERFGRVTAPRDKRMTVDEVVGTLESGMTIGIGGWGPRRKPMALVRGILRSDLTDLTIVSYGGADVGLLARAGKIKRLVFAFVSLDTIPIEPNFARARQAGTIPELVELDEGMLQTGLRAAAQRLPFLPMRAGLGSDVMTHHPDLRTVRSPYDDGQELVAVPALDLDVALVHLNRADRHGNATYLGPDPYFDDLFCLAAASRRLRLRRAGRRHRRAHRRRPGPAAAAQPDDGRRRRRDARRRPLHDLHARLRAGRGLPEGVRRGRGRRRGLVGLRAAVPLRRRGRLPGRGPQLRGGAVHERRHAGRGVRGRHRRHVRRRRRDLRQPDGDCCRRSASGSASSPPTRTWSSPTESRASWPASRRWAPPTRSSRAGSRSAGSSTSSRWGRRHVMMGASQLDRHGNQNISAIGDWTRPDRQLLGVRGAPGNTVNNRTSYWVPRHSPRVFVEQVDVVSGVGPARAREAGAARFHDIHRIVTDLAVLDVGGPDDTVRLLSVHPGVTVGRGPRSDRLRARRFPTIVADDPRAADGRDRADPRGARPARPAGSRGPGRTVTTTVRCCAPR